MIGSIIEDGRAVRRAWDTKGGRFLSSCLTNALSSGLRYGYPLSLGNSEISFIPYSSRVISHQLAIIQVHGWFILCSP